MKTNSSQVEEAAAVVMTPQNLLGHWQGHRSLTRRVIEKFPEDKFFDYSVGGMRPFAALAMEMIKMAAPSISGIVTGKWTTWEEGEGSNAPKTKAEYLKVWDETTEQLETLWPQIAPTRFQEIDVAFGQWEGPVYWIIMYLIDNEIHHRAQGYVYLRSLGIEPPPFWER